MHEVLVNHLGGLSLPRKSVVRLTDRPDMFTVDIKQQHNNNKNQKRIFSETNWVSISQMLSQCLSSKTYVFEDKQTKLQSV